QCQVHTIGGRSVVHHPKRLALYLSFLEGQRSGIGERLADPAALARRSDDQRLVPSIEFLPQRAQTGRSVTVVVGEQDERARRPPRRRALRNGRRHHWVNRSRINASTPAASTPVQTVVL